MKRLTFSQFYTGKFTDHGYELYIVKDADKAMYIGISRDLIWRRWFGGGTSHMDVGFRGKIYGKSRIGEAIERRLPNSWNWIIELWTKKDCLRILKGEFDGQNLDEIAIETIEAHMINRFAPLYNVLHGEGYHEDPVLTKNLDNAYKKIFG